eukprot:scaffold20034_cov107-Isochrysis_galbana.AAC.1
MFCGKAESRYETKSKLLRLKGVAAINGQACMSRLIHPFAPATHWKAVRPHPLSVDGRLGASHVPSRVKGSTPQSTQPHPKQPCTHPLSTARCHGVILYLSS